MKGSLGHFADISNSTKLRSIEYGKATLKVKQFLDFKVANSIDCMIGLPSPLLKKQTFLKLEIEIACFNDYL